MFFLTCLFGLFCVSVLQRIYVILITFKNRTLKNNGFVAVIVNNIQLRLAYTILFYPCHNWNPSDLSVYLVLFCMSMSKKHYSMLHKYQIIWREHIRFKVGNVGPIVLCSFVTLHYKSDWNQTWYWCWNKCRL